MKELERFPSVLNAAEEYLDQQQQLLDLCIQIQQIPAPTFSEQHRADWIEEYFKTIGLNDVAQDELANVYGRLPGKNSQPSLMVSAHTDTVFPAETDLKIRHNQTNSRVYGPAIGDNSVGVMGLIALAQELVQLSQPSVDIWFVANTAEEGIGDLRGMNAAVERLESQLGACIVLEGIGLGRIVHQALGSQRFRIEIAAPGGHSWSDYGSPSAVHILSKLASELVGLQLPTTPRTTSNIGRIWGGTSVNTIAQSAAMELDLRSEDASALDELVDQVLAIVQTYQTERNPSREATKSVVVDVEMIGNRPTGAIDREHPLVNAAVQALHTIGIGPAHHFRMSSTDANIPLSRSIPAICVGITEGGDVHRLTEWMNPTLVPRGMQHLLLLSWWTTLWLADEL